MPLRARPLAALFLGLLVLAGVVPATASPTAAGPSRPEPLWSAPLPGEPVVTRPFEPPPHRYGPGHRGVDLAAAPGSPVRAAGDGVVVFAGMVAGRPVVSVDHAGGLRTTYEPVTPSVGTGRSVVRGARLGVLLAGHDECPVAACLHWGARRGEVYLDPMSLLRPPRVRLLPLAGDAHGAPQPVSAR
ncbi:M23 family metallopeptidase [Blastococcus sp. SYSU DS0541]